MRSKGYPASLKIFIISYHYIFFLFKKMKHWDHSETISIRKYEIFEIFVGKYDFRVSKIVNEPI